MKTPLFHQHRRKDDPMEEIPPPPSLAQSSAGDRIVSYAVAPARFMSIKGAAAVLGLTEASIRARIARRVWLEGKHYRKAPDGRIFIDLKAIEAWIASGP